MVIEEHGFLVIHTSLRLYTITTFVPFVLNASFCVKSLKNIAKIFYVINLLLMKTARHPNWVITIGNLEVAIRNDKDQDKAE